MKLTSCLLLSLALLCSASAQIIGHCKPGLYFGSHET